MSQILSGFLSLNLKDVAKAAALVAITAFLTAIEQALSAHGFDVMSYDWGMIVDVSLTAGGSYLVKNLLSTSDGKVFGKIG